MKEISISLYKDNCKVMLPVSICDEWKKEGWKTQEDIKKEAEDRIDKFKIANKKDK